MSDRYAVIGRPINHTKSPLIHGLFANATGQQLEYGAIEGSLEAFEAQVHQFRDSGGLGMNITAPFKLRAFELADQRSERARLARAANALKFENGCITAENFDGIGLLRDIEVNLGEPLRNRRVLMLGAVVRYGGLCCRSWMLNLPNWWLPTATWQKPWHCATSWTIHGCASAAMRRWRVRRSIS